MGLSALPLLVVAGCLLLSALHSARAFTLPNTTNATGTTTAAAPTCVGLQLESFDLGITFAGWAFDDGGLTPVTGRTAATFVSFGSRSLGGDALYINSGLPYIVFPHVNSECTIGNDPNAWTGWTSDPTQLGVVVASAGVAVVIDIRPLQTAQQVFYPDYVVVWGYSYNSIEHTMMAMMGYWGPGDNCQPASCVPVLSEMTIAAVAQQRIYLTGDKFSMADETDLEVFIGPNPCINIELMLPNTLISCMTTGSPEDGGMLPVAVCNAFGCGTSNVTLAQTGGPFNYIKESQFTGVLVSDFVSQIMVDLVTGQFDSDIDYVAAGGTADSYRDTPLEVFAIPRYLASSMTAEMYFAFSQTFPLRVITTNQVLAGFDPLLLSRIVVTMDEDEIIWSTFATANGSVQGLQILD